MNKQILTDIVNSILGLSKKKKKEFVQILTDIQTSDNSNENNNNDSDNNKYLPYKEEILSEEGEREILFEETIPIYIKSEHIDSVDAYDYDVNLGHLKASAIRVTFAKDPSCYDILFKAIMLYIFDNSIYYIVSNFGNGNSITALINNCVFNEDNKRERLTKLIFDENGENVYKDFFYGYLGGSYPAEQLYTKGLNDTKVTQLCGTASYSFTNSFHSPVFLTSCKGFKFETEEQIEEFVDKNLQSNYSENNKEKISFIKNRPFYEDVIQYQTGEYEKNIIPYGEEITLYVKATQEADVDIHDYESDKESKTVNSYKLVFSRDYQQKDILFVCKALYETDSTYSGQNGFTERFGFYVYDYYDTKLKVKKIKEWNVKLAIGYNQGRYNLTKNFYLVEPMRNFPRGSASFGSYVMSAVPSFTSNYFMNKGLTLVYETSQHTYTYLKQIDDKFISDSIKNRITVLEQAVIAMGGTLS